MGLASPLKILQPIPGTDVPEGRDTASVEQVYDGI